MQLNRLGPLSSISLALLLSTAATAERKALVIGNGAYREGKLANPVGDAKAVAKKLRSLGFAVTLVTNTTLDLLEATVADYAGGLRSSDESFVFYAGHGVQLKESNYLVPVDFNARTEADAKSKAYDLARLVENVEDRRPRVSLIVLDACRNNPFRSVTRSASRGLRMLDAGGGSVIAFATSPGKTASDESIFTAMLLEHLGDPVEIRSVFNRVADAVARHTKREQVPWISASGLMEEYFLRAPKAVARPAEEAVARDEEPARAGELPESPPTSGAPSTQTVTSIITKPEGARITVDGRVVGNAPVLVQDLDPAHYHAVSAELEGYQPGRRALRIEPTGKTELHLTLEKIAGADAVAAAGGGYLIIASTPVARVTVDGRETGRWSPVPPANPLSLAAGDHTVVLVTADGVRLEEQVTIESGKTTILIRKLKAAGP